MAEIDELVPQAPPRTSALPTPSERAAMDAELIRVKNEGLDTAPPVAGDAPTAPAEIDEQLLASIELKTAAGEALTPEEQVVASKIDTEVKLEPPKVYKIAGQELSQADIEARFKIDYPVWSFEGKTPQAISEMMDLYVKGQNRSEASRSIDRGQKDNSQEREYLRQQRMQMETQASTLISKSAELVEQYKELEKIAMSSITEADIKNPDTGEYDFTKASQLIAKNNAMLELPKRAQEINNTKQAITKVQNETLQARISEFQSAHAQYKTTEPLDLVLAKMNRSDPTLNIDDKFKVRELSRFISEANPQMSFDMEDVYQEHLRKGDLAVKPAAQTAGAALPDLSSAPTFLEKLKEYKNRKKIATPGSRGSGDPQSQPKPSTAKQMIEQSHEILGNRAAIRRPGDPSYM
jgi:hypothetical protein